MRSALASIFRSFESTATLLVAGDELLLPVRACLAMEDGSTATICEDVEAYYGGHWVDFDDLGISPGDRERVMQQLCELAFGDR